VWSLRRLDNGGDGRRAERKREDRGLCLWRGSAKRAMESGKRGTREGRWSEIKKGNLEGFLDFCQNETVKIL